MNLSKPGYDQWNKWPTQVDCATRVPLCVCVCVWVCVWYVCACTPVHCRWRKRPQTASENFKGAGKHKFFICGWMDLQCFSGSTPRHKSCSPHNKRPPLPKPPSGYSPSGKTLYEESLQALSVPWNGILCWQMIWLSGKGQAHSMLFDTNDTNKYVQPPPPPNKASKLST